MRMGSKGKQNILSAVRVILALALILAFSVLPAYADVSDPLPEWAEEGASWDEEMSTLSDRSISYADGSATGTKTLRGNSKVTFLNTKSAAVPTGLPDYTDAGLLLMLVSACGIAAVFAVMLRRGRKTAALGESGRDRRAGGGRAGSSGGHRNRKLLMPAAALLGAGILSALIIGGGTAFADGENNSDTHSLIIEKDVAGNMASRDKYFQVTAYLTGLTPGTQYSLIYSGGASAGTQTPTASTSYASVVNPSSFAADASGNATVVFYLQGGQGVSVKDLPDGAGYSVSEDSEDYTPAYKVEATSVSYVTLTITPYLDVSSYSADWTKDQQKLHDAYTYKIPKGTAVNLSDYGLNDPDLRFYRWMNGTDTSVLASGGNSARAAAITLDTDCSIEEWYYARFGYYMINMDRGYWAYGDRTEARPGAENASYCYRFIQFGLQDDSANELGTDTGGTPTGQYSTSRTGYTLDGWYTKPESEGWGEKITGDVNLLSGTIEPTSYENALAYYEALVARRNVLTANFLDKTADATQTQKDGLDTYMALMQKADPNVSYTRSSSYVAEKMLYAKWTKNPTTVVAYAGSTATPSTSNQAASTSQVIEGWSDITWSAEGYKALTGQDPPADSTLVAVQSEDAFGDSAWHSGTDVIGTTSSAVWARAIRFYFQSNSVVETKKVRIRGRYRPNGITQGTGEVTFYEATVLTLDAGTYQLNDEFFESATGQAVPDGYTFGGVISPNIFGDTTPRYVTNTSGLVGYSFDISSWSYSSSYDGYIYMYFGPVSSGAKQSAASAWDEEDTDTAGAVSAGTSLTGGESGTAAVDTGGTGENVTLSVPDGNENGSVSGDEGAAEAAGGGANAPESAAETAGSGTSGSPEVQETAETQAGS